MNVVKHIKYWIKYPHLHNIKYFGLITHLKFVFNFNISKCVVTFQQNIKNKYKLPHNNIIFKKANLNSTTDKNILVNIINESFSEYGEFMNIHSLNKHIHNNIHLIVNDVIIITCNNKPIGCFTLGLFKENPKVGSWSRISIIKKYRKRNIGNLMYMYMVNYFIDMNIHFIQMFVSFKRLNSILFHIKQGFFIQTNKKYIIGNNQKRMFPIKYLVNHKCKHIHKKYINRKIKEEILK